MPITLTINGKAHQADVDPGTPLLWTMRDTLGILGPKFGCGIAQCGACTVLVDGKPVRSCVTPVAAVRGAVTTIEGIGETALGQRIKDAWLELDVAQCGYCQGGQIVSATALLTKAPDPTDAEIDQGMRGNICRCATYLRIKAAIKLAASRASA